MRSRPRSWSWRVRPGRSAGATRWRAGCTGSRCGSPRARSASARGRRHERGWAASYAARAGGEGGREKLGRLLHEELGRLPERFRAPIVLCYLEGRTHEEAARVLRCPVGTIKSRLATARARLRGRLERDQLFLPAGLVEATVRSATRGAGAVIPPVASRLAEGALRAMLLNRLVAAAAALIPVAALAIGVGGLAFAAKGLPARPEL